MNETNPRKYSYTAMGMIIGTAVAFGLGLILWLATHQPLFLLVGMMGTGVGLALGAGIDAAGGGASEGEEGEFAGSGDGRPADRDSG